MASFLLAIMASFLLAILHASVLSRAPPSPCQLLKNISTCAETTGCAWCDAGRDVGSCYMKETESCCAAPTAYDCAGRWSICDAFTERCELPMWECEYAGSPTCIPANLTACTNRHGVIGCALTDKCCYGACLSTSFCCANGTTCCPGATCFAPNSCCSATEICNISTGQCY